MACPARDAFQRRDNTGLCFPPNILTVTNSSAALAPDLQQLDALTGGAFSAATAGERAARVRAWLASDPTPEQMQRVFKELSVKDKGAAKLLRERLDDLRRARNQEAMAAEWASKAEALLQAARFHVADALAWQRDAAKAGAPLGREPLAGLKTQLVDRIKAIEDLQHRAQVQREAALLLAQRIEVLSTKALQEALAALAGLHDDVAAWRLQADNLLSDAHWESVDLRFAPMLETARSQLSLVWEAFCAAIDSARLAQSDANAPLPLVPVWADELRLARGELVSEPPSAKPAVAPEVIELATTTVQQALQKLELEVAEGHGKASTGAAAALRQALKDHGRHIDGKLDKQAHAALAAAGELEGWQRWRADQLRQELLTKAEALLNRPEGQALGGRKMQETLRSLREQWKQTDQGGVPNHALWKRFDEACNQAHKVVEAWLEKVRAEAAAQRAKRLALIEEVRAWAAAHEGQSAPDWKSIHRELHQFAERWREAGHLSEKQFAELQPQWKAVLAQAGSALAQAQAQSLNRRQAMIEEASALGEAPVLRIDAVKALQQRWQAEAHAVPLERRQEQKLWDAFRQPIDAAFNRKTAAREQAIASMSARDRKVIEAAKTLEAANASGDAQAIRAAMAALHSAQQGLDVPEPAAQPAADVVASPAVAPDSAQSSAQNSDSGTSETREEASPAEAGQAVGEKAEEKADEKAAEISAPKAASVARKPVVAVRGDDRPGMKKAAPALPAGRGKPERGVREGRAGRNDERPARGGGRFEQARAPRSEAPRLGDAAFRAQREALEHAEAALRKLSAQAHGEALTRLLQAWKERQTDALPSAQELGGRVSASVRQSWSQSLATEPSNADAAATALLRLEMAAEVPTPAAELQARRNYQLQLLTRRNDPTPAQTWAQDVARVLAAAYEDSLARRLQAALKVLLRR